MDMHNVRQLLKVKSIYDIPLRVTYYARVSSESDEQLNSLGNQTLASYTYTTDQNHHLSKLDYGNGDSVQYSYDNYGRLVQETFEDGDTVSYKYDNTGALATDTDSATYNADGLRTSRTDGYTTYEYVYHGSQLTQMTVGDDRLRFGYDANGTPLYVIWNQSKYFYVTNLQGDVVAIVSESGYAVVRYTYDAWGNILSITGMRADNLGILNPLRYRGYVYDHETEFYYLQSRYYDPEGGRFLNADIVYDYDAGLQGFNLFIYCGNNPINRIDISGADSEEFDGDPNLKDEEEAMTLGPGGDGKSSGGKCTITGGGHGNNIHSNRIDTKINNLAATGDYSEIYGNRAFTTAGLNGSWRPDILARRVDGAWEVWEFASPSQRSGTVGYQMLENKIGLMSAANSSVLYFHIVPW